MALPKAHFDSETVALMAQAFEAAWHELQARHLVDGEQQAARSAIACTIMAAVVDGERDHQQLVSIAVRSLAAYGQLRST